MIDGDQTVFQEDRSPSAGSAYDLVLRSATDRHGWPAFLDNSLVRREFLAEHEEILKHKWIESEKAGQDIGWDSALIDWVIKHRSQWRKNRHSQRVGGFAPAQIAQN
jgi:hypothetical protein